MIPIIKRSKKKPRTSMCLLWSQTCGRQIDEEGTLQKTHEKIFVGKPFDLDYKKVMSNVHSLNWQLSDPEELRRRIFGIVNSLKGQLSNTEELISGARGRFEHPRSVTKIRREDDKLSCAPRRLQLTQVQPCYTKDEGGSSESPCRWRLQTTLSC